MSNWISVNDRLPKGIPGKVKQVLVATNYGSRPTEWREAIWEYGTFRTPYEHPHTGTRLPFKNVTHWCEVGELPPPLEPQLTVREALRQAVAVLDEAHQSTRGSREVSIDRWWGWSGEAAKLLPRLRAALESEE